MDQDVIIKKMQELASKINYQYDDIQLLKKAMYCQIIHNEYDGKNRKNYSNDSYATLGDSVLKLVLTEYFFDKGDDKKKITEVKQRIEDNETLYSLCNKLEIYEYAYNDYYFSTDAPKENQVYHSKHDIYIEAIIAAIYKDKGFAYTRNWVIDFFKQNSNLI
jgi:ribonuclease-3